MIDLVFGFIFGNRRKFAINEAYISEAYLFVTWRLMEIDGLNVFTIETMRNSLNVLQSKNATITSISMAFEILEWSTTNMRQPPIVPFPNSINAWLESNTWKKLRFLMCHDEDDLTRQRSSRLLRELLLNLQQCIGIGASHLKRIVIETLFVHDIILMFTSLKHLLASVNSDRYFLPTIQEHHSEYSNLVNDILDLIHALSNQHQKTKISKLGFKTMPPTLPKFSCHSATIPQDDFTIDHLKCFHNILIVGGEWLLHNIYVHIYIYIYVHIY
ncbi:hypothetical protein RFI_22185 [Reticulomyxa filosa]|uniref:Uncharacterized protein n=1 Tax=Reticulomyxa filosa TaxID=46433 RepID=X6MP07_RETFI|nr:hypothetical protein RFI_22185 [Reticulomyxa filosa]|eukprot:ETO15177.1 hypothetical protein RFI_22185 [Reticulomyxa filosa]